MGKPSYKKLIYQLHVELCKFQSWVQDTDERVIVVFEGRDSAGKGGMIKTIMERVSHRVFNSVALPAPSDRESTQWYPQRYVRHFPSAGEVVLFDRSWYNRAGVEKVMGFTEPERIKLFLKECSNFETAVVDSGIRLIKYWLDIKPDTQFERLNDRIKDPRKHWKLSGMDLESRRLWYQYSMARDDIFKHTDTENSPWYIVPSDNKEQARVNCITHFLGQFEYHRGPVEMPTLPDISQDDAYDDVASIAERRFVPQVYGEDC